MQKTFIGTQLRQLRREKSQTQAEMGRVLGVTAAYINLLEKNQRSLSVSIFMALADTANLAWREGVMGIRGDLGSEWR